MRQLTSLSLTLILAVVARLGVGRGMQDFAGGGGASCQGLEKASKRPSTHLERW